MIRRLLILLLILQIAACSDDTQTFQKENITGKWVVTEVHNDGVDISEWTGVHLIFEQNKVNAGHYSMSETKNDSVWSSDGIWKKLTDFSLVLNDTVTVNYQCDGASMIISMYLPWTAKDPCNDFICIPVVTGTWDFKFEREK